MLRLFIFHDDIEEILVSAVDDNDAFDVVDEAYGAGVADDLILSYLHEYPSDFVLTRRGLTAGAVVAIGRRVVAHRSGNSKRMVKPLGATK